MLNNTPAAASLYCTCHHAVLLLTQQVDSTFPLNAVGGGPGGPGGQGQGGAEGGCAGCEVGAPDALLLMPPNAVDTQNGGFSFEHNRPGVKATKRAIASIILVPHRRSALLNQAACHLKLGANRDAISAADKVHGFVSTLGQASALLNVSRKGHLLTVWGHRHAAMGQLETSSASVGSPLVLPAVYIAHHQVVPALRCTELEAPVSNHRRYWRRTAAM